VTSCIKLSFAYSSSRSLCGDDRERDKG